MCTSPGFWARVVLAVMALGFAVTPRPVAAAELRTEDDITVAETEVIDDDLYAFGNTITILGTVTGDVIAAGQTVNIAGKVGGSVLAAGNSVTISGVVRGSIRAAGQSVTVSGLSGRDLMLAGNTVIVTDSARALFDVYAAAGTLDIGGEAGRDLMLAGGDMTVRGAVGRDIQADGDKLRLGEAARVGGNLTFGGPQPPVVPVGATVRGQTRHDLRTAEAERRPEPADLLLDLVRSFVGMSVFTLLCVFGLPGTSGRAVQRLNAAPLGSFALGAAVLGATLILAPFLFLFGIVVGGWWIGPVLLLLLLPLTLAGYAISAFTAGRWLALKLGRPDLARGWAVLLGVGALTAMQVVPVAGALTWALAAFLGLGALIAALASGNGEALPQSRLVT